jgi:hypothetical protein
MAENITGMQIMSRFHENITALPVSEVKNCQCFAKFTRGCSLCMNLGEFNSSENGL